MNLYVISFKQDLTEFNWITVWLVRPIDTVGIAVTYDIIRLSGQAVAIATRVSQANCETHVGNHVDFII